MCYVLNILKNLWEILNFTTEIYIKWYFRGKIFSHIHIDYKINYNVYNA